MSEGRGSLPSTTEHAIAWGILGPFGLWPVAHIAKPDLWDAVVQTSGLTGDERREKIAKMRRRGYRIVRVRIEEERELK